MTHYRRNFIAGGSYFFTVALAERSSRLLTDPIDVLRQAVHQVKSEKPVGWDEERTPTFCGGEG